MIRMMFFEPQTGIIDEDAWESNFYQFRLRNSCRGWVETAISQATMNGQGLEYPEGFLKNVADAEAEADDTIRQHCRRFPDSTLFDEVPRKQSGELF